MLSKQEKIGDNLIKNESNIGSLFSLAIILLLTVSQNPDFSNRLLWWGAVGFFLIAFCFNCKGVFVIDNVYLIWIFSFAFLCLISFFWAKNPNLVFETMKNLLVQCVLLVCLSCSIKSERDIDKILKIVLITIVFNSVYLLLTNSDMFLSRGGEEEVIERLGTSDGWNANGVGFMTSTGMVISLFLLKYSGEKKYRLLYFAVFVLTVFTTLITGSRTAFIKILISLACFMFLSSRGKRLKAVLIIAVCCLGLYFVVMNVPFFYSIIGWRMEGLEALILGVGEVDNSADIRDRFIVDAFERWLERPIFGYGIDCYRAVNTVKAGYYSHNNFVEILADLGIVGFLLYYFAYFGNAVRLLFVKGDNKYKWLFLTLILGITISDYGTVSYVTLLTAVMLALTFSFLSVNGRQNFS